MTKETFKENEAIVIGDLTIDYQFLIRKKSKATAGVKNTASYILWLYTTWDQMVALNMIYLFYF